MNKILLLITVYLMNSTSQANYACDDKLQNKKWPLDCFILLSTSSTKKTDKKYTDLNSWCKIYHLELLKQEPPKAVFSLYMPKNCLNIALKANKHHFSQKILNGSFLNSFL